MINQFIVHKQFEIFHWWRKRGKVTKMLVILIQFKLFFYYSWFIQNVPLFFTPFHFCIVSGPWRCLVPIHLLIVCITFSDFLLSSLSMISSTVSLSMISSTVSFWMYSSSSLSLSFCRSSSLSAGIGNGVTLVFLL